MTTVRSAKQKGAQMEYSAYDSLKPIMPDILLTAHLGYREQYDLVSRESKCVFECKRLRGMSWNQAKKFLEKLEGKAPEGYECLLLFKSNRQPCLIMWFNVNGDPMVKEFEHYFKTSWVKHVGEGKKIIIHSTPKGLNPTGRKLYEEYKEA